MAQAGSFISRAFRRLRRDGGAVLPYALGRFYSLRRAYAFSQRLVQRAPRLPLEDSLFPAVDVDAAVESIRASSVYQPVHLPDRAVAELRSCAENSPLRSFDLPDREFFFSEVHDGRLADEVPITWAHVKGVQEHPLAKKIAFDPKVLAVMDGYFGYTPKHADIWMFWSFAGKLSDEDRRRAGQTIDYHFDVHSMNFAYAAYYLTDTDRSNGAHQMICGSHRRKPLRWLLGSAKQPDTRVESHYGRANVLTIEGPAGTGFWQDSSCYHKALAPQTGARLLLQCRYY